MARSTERELYSLVESMNNDPVLGGRLPAGDEYVVYGAYGAWAVRVRHADTSQSDCGPLVPLGQACAMARFALAAVRAGVK